MFDKSLVRILLAGWIVLATAVLAAEPPGKISALGSLDRQFMEQQRNRIDELARFDLGRQLQADKNHNLDILQTLLDRRVVIANQTVELQAMGVVLGDLLAAELGMKWVIYEDRYGRSRALQLGSSDNFLFPITMISRRVEAGAQVDVSAVYEKAYKIIEPYRTPLPFR
jgi:hypothetical protein